MSWRPDIAWTVGVTDESYGAQVWINRIENLKCWIEMIRSYVPEHPRKEWLDRLIDKAIGEADGYISDAVPSDEKDQAA